jgi:hypothetical protein
VKATTTTTTTTTPPSAFSLQLSFLHEASISAVDAHRCFLLLLLHKPAIHSKLLDNRKEVLFSFAAVGVSSADASRAALRVALSPSRFQARAHAHPRKGNDFLVGHSIAFPADFVGG